MCARQPEREMEWSTTLRRWDERVDYKPDDETEAGTKVNLQLVCDMIDDLGYDGFAVPRDCPEHDLLARDILEVNVAFYRYEMFNVPPPPCLAVDCGEHLARNGSVRKQLDCDDIEMRRLRCSFSMDYLTDGVALLLKEYDEEVENMRAYSNRCVTSKPLPRDFGTLARKIQPSRGAAKPAQPPPLPSDASIRHSKWRTPKDVCTYAGGVYARSDDQNRGPLNVLASSVAQCDDEELATAHARRRLVATICWFRRHARAQLEPMIVAMAGRAMRSALLYELAARMRDAARCVAAERARSSDPLTLLVAGDASEELGEALWPYLPPEAGPLIMKTCKTLHAWGVRFRRDLHLRLHTNTSFPHHVEEDGTLSILKHKRINLAPSLEYTFLKHFEGSNATSALRNAEHPQKTHGPMVDVERSSTRAFLVLNNRKRTPVMHEGGSALRRVDTRKAIVRGGALDDVIFAHFPKGALPRIEVSVPVLSSRFAKKGHLPGRRRFRIVVEVTIVARGSTTGKTYSDETAPFRVVARMESPAAEEARKKRVVEQKAADKRHGRCVRAARAAAA